MGIDLRVAGDEQSCRAAAQQLTSLAEGIIKGGTAFYTARSESESLWEGTAGDAFRERMQPVGRSVDDVADHTHRAGQVLHGFADDLGTVKARMNQACEIATFAGLPVTGDTIEEPNVPQPVQGPTTTSMTRDAAQAQQDYQRQQQAYRQAQQAVSEARTLEGNAHTTLEQRMNGWQTMLRDAVDQRYWLAGGNVAGLVGTAISQADKWGKVAADRTALVEVFKKIAATADDPFTEAAAARAAGVFEPVATEAQAALEGNLKWTARLAGTKAGDVLAASLDDIPRIGSTLPGIAEKLPIVGGLVALGQTAWDSQHARNAGDVAIAAGADVGGYAAGSLATEGVLTTAASIGLAGGPVTLAAVGIGVGVAFGVGELVNHAPDIAHWAAHTVSDIGHGVENAGKAVGHFFSGLL